MRIKNVNGPYVFARNPIVVESSFSGADFDPKGGRISVALDGENVYAGRFSAPLSMDLSEILDSNITYFPEAQQSGEIIQRIFDASGFERYGVEVEAAYGGMDDYVGFTVLPGGVSHQNFKSWAQWGEDAMSGRFMTKDGNFFLTTRTAGWIIAVKETEIHPLYFVRNTAGEVFQIFNSVTGDKLYEGTIESGCYALDIEALRRANFLAKKGLLSAFDLHVDGQMACRIVVENATSSEHRHRIKFRNSLGVFEIMDTTGKLDLTPEYDDGKSFKRMDPATRALYNERERIERSMAATLYTGPKRRDEIPFLMDMVSSDEVYLLDFCQAPVKVIPTVKNLEITTNATVPLEVELSLRFVDSESNILQEIFTGNESRRQRVFSEQFNDKFN